MKKVKVWARVGVTFTVPEDDLINAVSDNGTDLANVFMDSIKNDGAYIDGECYIPDEEIEDVCPDAKIKMLECYLKDDVMLQVKK